MEQSNKFNIYSNVTDKIIADLEKGVRPWQKPWNSAHTAVFTYDNPNATLSGGAA